MLLMLMHAVDYWPIVIKNFVLACFYAVNISFITVIIMFLILALLCY